MEEQPSGVRSRFKRAADRDDSGLSRIERLQKCNELDRKFGYESLRDSSVHLGWLINMHPSDVLNEERRLVSSVDFYFVQEDGGRFKVTMPYQPYFYIATTKDSEREVASFLSKKLSGRLAAIDMVDKEDLDLANHLVGIQATYLKLRFHSVEDLMKAKRDIMPAVKKNREKEKSLPVYDPTLFTSRTDDTTSTMLNTRVTDQMDNIIDIREYDVPYHVRVAIDLKINVGHWYNVRWRGLDPPELTLVEDEPDRPEPVVMAYDIETTKLPLKFPDPAIDCIMMISYMIDAQGYLLINREVVSADVEDFEYTPKPEFEGYFTVYNEPDEVSLLKHFIGHILEVRPNIIVTYNGDVFDWPFLDSRCSFHGITLVDEIGFAPDTQEEYKCRPIIHMDAFRWVKRDSYLPVGSQNLKAAAKAKLRYAPVELDPEEMCRMASENPQVLANYSVSDAVATYYLYMKYVHPFIFALCTIIPMEPDEVLRKGSGTLCEALLMVQAFHGNIVFPNRQEAALGKLTSDGHLLDQETYVGGHVEAIEAGVFRSDLPCRFKLNTETLTDLMDKVSRTIKHAIEVEEKIPLDQVTNYHEVCKEIVAKLSTLRDHPIRSENPMIYHLDVGAMYPNIILTNRLQPSAIVDEATCAACDFNKPESNCQRKMNWSWRGEFLPASRSEYHHIKHQLEAENIPGESPGDPPRSFHSLPPVEQARLEKKRLAEYCRKAYRRVKVTREEQRVTTVCQRENSFYVDTVRAFRDRRYRFKGLLKQWRKKLDTAKKSGDPAEIKSCQNKEILYDSLQLAHKCILNSFYGYVMRKGARWYSMEMAGIVCHTGANIITMAREVVENIGRPLELDTDGIWCVLPASFPENYKLNTTNPNKKSVIVCYPGAMLNMMVQDHFTNDQYQELVDPAKLDYTQRSENSIFFEVDGPYRAMILPASKEEGKKLKKRYAVFNDDGSLAELKGFEVKRRGELQLVKNFQSSVFEAFLRGSTLQECYQSVAQVADYWLDVLYSQAEHMPDNELFELISENRNMSRKLEDYGELKSTSISTAKRLAEFLGDQMVKDAGLSCRYIISRKPEGAPVTERAIPLAIFQAESSVRQHYLRKWLKSSHLDNFDIRSILDWNYYIERLGSAVQKIITIPAAMQGVANPVPRVKHPDWLHKRLLEKNDVFRQKQIFDMFPRQPKPAVAELGGDDLDVRTTPSQKKRPIEATVDMEDIGSVTRPHRTPLVSKNTVHSCSQSDERKSWREVLGPPPPRGVTKEQFTDWLAFHKKKWEWQRQQRKLRKKGKSLFPATTSASRQASQHSMGNLTGFLRRRANILVENPWQIIQIKQTASLGMFTLWALIGDQLHRLSLEVPRIFYVNSYTVKQLAGEGHAWRRVSRALPHSSPAHHLYQYSVSEEVFQRHMGELAMQLSAADIEGVYETQVPLLFRAIVTLGCVCTVAKEHVKTVLNQDLDVFQLNQLQYRTLAHSNYLDNNCLHRIYLYHSNMDSRSLFAVYLSSLHKISIFVVDRVRTNTLPNMTTLYQSERNSRLSCYGDDYPVPHEDITFDIRVDVDQRLVCRAIHRLIANYRDQRRGPSLVLLQSPWAVKKLSQLIPSLDDFPQVVIPSLDSDNQYPALDWQRVASRRMIRQLLNLPSWLQNQLESCRYSLVPIGNMSTDQPLFISDIFYTRHLTQHNHIIWCSPTNQPDLGGHESDDYRLATESGRGIEINEPGAYPTVCIEFALDGLAVTTVYKSHMINEFEGVGSTAASFDSAPQISLEEMMSGGPSAQSTLTVYDEAALCSGAFKILRSLVGAWLHEVMNNQNYFADLQLQHFYRWLHTPSVLLYEPSICRLIHGLMKKLFLQLIGEFKHLGSTIVYANYNKIIVCTKKKSIEDACAYARFILESIHSKELFQFLTIEPITCWTYLMWMDQANNGGIRGKLPREIVERDEDISMEDDDLDQVEMNWMIAKFLPKACQQLFQIVVAGHINAVYQHLSHVGQIATPSNRAQSSQSQVSTADTATMATLVTFCQHRITNKLTEQLYMAIQKVHQNIGRHSDGEAPALQLVKYICKVLSLDPGTQHQVAKLRRDLLQLIGVREFSSEAIYTSPGYSYVLPEVICDSCNHCRDVDLCRDPCIQPDETTGRPMWRCSHCGSEYNSMVIEQRLVDAVQQLSLTDVLQDVECARCHGVKDTNISDYCSCAGEFCNTSSSDKLVDQLIMFDSIAKDHDMLMLDDCIQWILTINHISLSPTHYTTYAQ